MKKIIYTLGIITSFIFSSNAQIIDTLYPVQDGHYFTFGGGEGANALMKFDISTLPASVYITKATIQVFVYDTFGSNGNVLFRNFNIQTWTENDTAAKFDPGTNPAIVYTDSTYQLSGFGDSIGIANSVDLKAIVLRDYNVSNTYCTFLLKDPDDMTCCGAVGPGFGTYLGNSFDSLPFGNLIFGENTNFYPREYATMTMRPKLIVEYELAPVVTVDPMANVNVCVGDSVTLSVSAMATNSPINYQWQKNNVNIPGAVASVYKSLAAALDTPGSNYRCYVYNNAGSDTSLNSLVRVDSCFAPPTFMSSSLVDTSFCINDTIIFSVTFSGIGVNYQWQKNGVNIGGANDAIYQYIPLFSDVAGSNYRCIGSNVVGSDTSNVALIKIDSCVSNAIRTNLFSNKLKLYPNPVSSDILTIQIDDVATSEYEIVIFNNLGKKVYSKVEFISNGYVKKEISVSNFKKGMYYLTLRSKQGMFTEKILIQ